MTMTGAVATSVWGERDVADAMGEVQSVASAIAPSIVFDGGLRKLMVSTIRGQVYTGGIMPALATALALWEADDGPHGRGGWWSECNATNSDALPMSKRSRQIASDAKAYGHLEICGPPWDPDDQAMAAFEAGVLRGMSDPRVRHQIKQGLREVCAGQSRVEHSLYSEVVEPPTRPAARTRSLPRRTLRLLARSLARRTLRLPARPPEMHSSDELRLSVWTVNSWECLCGFAVREESPGTVVVVHEGENRTAVLRNYMWGSDPGLSDLLSVERRMISHLISEFNAITR